MFTSLSAVPAASGGLILTAGVSGPTTGWQKFAYGSITPDPALVLGDELIQVSTSDSNPDLATVEFAQQDIGEAFWSLVTIIGVFSGGQLTQQWDRVADSFFYDGNVGGNSRWQSNSIINSTRLFVNGNVYQVSVQG